KAFAAARSGTAGRWEIRQGDVLDRLAEIDPGSARLVFADPPYNEGVDYGQGAAADRLPDAVYLDLCRRWINLVPQTLTPDGSFWLLVSHKWDWQLIPLARKAGLHFRQRIIWFETFGSNCTRKFNRCSRPLLWFVRDPKRFVFNE